MNTPLTILLADDDPADQQAFRWAVEDCGENVDLRIVSDGDTALRYLFRKDIYQDAERYPQPAAIVIDLNMPKVSGFAILNSLRLSPELNAVPVVVMSNSTRPSDKIQTRGLGAREFCLKPNSPAEYQEVVFFVIGLAKHYLMQTAKAS
ncbi:MAG: response regulator [Planctomycetes bacterium]|nr:response regulator [Planctomycetota bacterium]NUQ34193.1 response regulator [Planctomycetaceae bacterium]